jgi:hypothetical protein
MEINMEEFEEFTVDKSQNKASKITEDKFYTIWGMEDFIDDDGNTRQTKETKNTFAKAISSKYFIKIGLDNRVYNPIGLFSEGRPNKVLSKIGKNEFNFKRVNAKVFDWYLSFLRTKNIAWLNNANRELL